MSLYERLARARARTIEPPNGDGAEPLAFEEEVDPFSHLRQSVHRALLDSLGPKLYDPKMTAEQLGARVRKQVGEALESEGVPISASEKGQLVSEITDDILGYGPIEPFLRDPTVTEVMVNGPGAVYIERGGKIERTNVRFLDDSHLRRIIEKVVGQIGRRIDEAQPFVDARLPDGSRVNAVIPPVAVDGPLLTVRKFSQDPIQMEDLIERGTIVERVGEFLATCVEGRVNLLVSGGAGVGKTTTLNVLSSFISRDERIVTIEDAAELQLMQPHVARLEARPANIEGRGEITIRDLLRNSLRMRPDRIVIGEVRGGESLDMLQAMNTGHEGSMSTIHANAPRDVLSRLETMCLMAGMELPVSAVRQQIARSVQLVVHQTRLKDGTRRVTRVTEITGMEGDVITTQDLFRFDYGMGVDAKGRFKGRLKSTGLRPVLASHLEDHGMKVESKLFAPERFVRDGEVA